MLTWISRWALRLNLHCVIESIKVAHKRIVGCYAIEKRELHVAMYEGAAMGATAATSAPRSPEVSQQAIDA